MLVRASGTEPLVRVMVEAPTADEADAVCARLVAAVEAAGEADACGPSFAASTYGRGAASARPEVQKEAAMCGIVGYVGGRPVQEISSTG